MKTEISTIENTPGERSVVFYEDKSSPLMQDGMLEKMMQLAKLMASSKLLPKDFHNSPGDCLRVIELAHRVGQSPFAIADGSYVIQGRLAMDGKTIASLVNSNSRIVGSLNYAYSGERSKPKTYTCTVSGYLRGESEPRTVDVDLALGMSDSKGARARWEKDPDQMLAYYGARVWARRHAPEVIGGLYTPDELRTIDPKPLPALKKPPMKDIEPIASVEPVEDFMGPYVQEVNQALENNDEHLLKKTFAYAWKMAKMHDETLLPDVKKIYDDAKVEIYLGPISAEELGYDEHGNRLDPNKAMNDLQD